MSERAPKTILVISYAFWPMNIVGALRPIHVVSDLVRRGYNPVVLTTKPWDTSINDIDFGREVAEQIAVERVGFFWPVSAVRKIRTAVLLRLRSLEDKYSHRRFLCALIRRIRGLFSSVILLADSFFDVTIWSVGIICHGIGIARKAKVDCIFCTVPPGFSLAAVSLLSGLIRAPLVLDFRDLWSLHEYAEFWNGRNSRLRRWVRSVIERYAVRKSARVIYNTATAKTLMDARYPAGEQKSVAITNGMNIVGATSADQSQSNGVFRILHFGSLYGDRNPADFFDGLRQWIDDKGKDVASKVSVIFVGRGTDQIRRTAKEYGLEQVVSTHEQKSKKELQDITSDADAFLLCLGYREASRYVVPAKMYDYIGAEKPIIAFAPDGGEVQSLMKRLKLEENVVVAAGPEKVKEILEREYERHISKQPDFHVSPELKQNFDYSFIAGQIGSVIEQAAGNDRTGD